MQETIDIHGTFHAKVRLVLAQDLRESRLSRPQIAGRIGISVAMLDAYIAETKPHRFPVELIPEWIEVLGSRRILDAICEACGGLSVATEEDNEFAELGRAALTQQKLGQKLWEKI
jgi:hypothetical protein